MKYNDEHHKCKDHYFVKYNNHLCQCGWEISIRDKYVYCQDKNILYYLYPDDDTPIIIN